MKAIRVRLLRKGCIAVALLCSMFMVSCNGLSQSKDPIVATYGEKKIPLAEAELLARLSQYSYEKSFFHSGANSSFWEKDLSGTGKSTEQVVKQDIMMRLYQTCVLLDAAKRDGIKLDEEQQKKVDESVKLLLEDKDLQGKIKMDKALVTKIYTENAIANLEKQHLLKSVDRNLKEEDFLQKDFTVITVTKDDDTATDEKVIAQDIENEWKKGKTPADIIKGYDGKTFKVTETTVSFGPNDEKNPQAPAFVKEVMTMKHNDYKVVEDNGNYHVFLCTNEKDMEKTREAMSREISTREQTAFKDIYEGLLKTAPAFKVDEEVWGTVNFKKPLVEIPETTATGETTTAVETTPAGETTAAAETTVSAETTVAPATTTAGN